MEPRHIGAGYTEEISIISSWKLIVKMLVLTIKSYDIEFDTIVCRGFSGISVVPAVAAALGKEILFIRKNTADSHSRCLCEGNGNIGRYIIIDDFVITGKTIQEILKTMEGISSGACLVGIFAYMMSAMPEDGIFKTSFLDSRNVVNQVSCPLVTFSIRNKKISTINGFSLGKKNLLGFSLRGMKKWMERLEIQFFLALNPAMPLRNRTNKPANSEPNNPLTIPFLT